MTILSAVNHGSSNAPTVTLPAGIPDGSVAYYLNESGSSGSPGTPSGWTLLDDKLAGANNSYARLFTKPVGSADSGTTITGSYTTTFRWVSMVVVVTASSHDTLSYQVNGTLTTSPATPAYTPSVDNCLALILIGSATASGGGPVTSTPPSGYTEIADTDTGFGSGVNQHDSSSFKQLGAGTAGVQQPASNGTTSTTTRSNVWVATVKPAVVAIPHGGGAGTVHVDGSASGSATHQGGASGTIHVDGAATGHAVHAGAAAGTVQVTGTAAGHATHTGAAAGTVHVDGSASGSARHSGAAAGTVQVDGAASGSAVHSGSATGQVQVDGSASGTAPALGVPHGGAAGTVHVDGTASGSTTHQGAATGTVQVDGSASGQATHRGSSIGTVEVAGAASGSAAHTGSATGTVEVRGAASGHAPGSIARDVDWNVGPISTTWLAGPVSTGWSTGNINNRADAAGPVREGDWAAGPVATGWTAGAVGLTDPPDWKAGPVAVGWAAGPIYVQED